MNPTKNGVINNFVPTEFYLSQNFPNPFKEKTTIKFCVAYKTRVKITVFNSEDEMVERLIDEVKESGTYEIEFSVSSHLSRGIYPYCLEAGNYSKRKEMVLQK
jgi:Secretion system C-terminal sorting domain